MTDNADDIRVLVVDDEQDIRDGCERILSRMGCQVFKAAQGEEALETIAGESIALVFLDLKMPGLDGMEVLRRIQVFDPTILVIVITGYATVETAIEAMKRGAYDFIPKPFEPDQLRIVAGRAREKLKLTREAQRLAQERERMLFDLDTEKSRTRTIIEALPTGVVVTNALGQVVLMNPAFAWYFDLDPALGSGEQIKAYVADEGFCKLVMDISTGKHADPQQIPTYEFALPDGKYLQAQGRPVLGEDGECIGAAVLLMDITAMKVLDRLKSEFVTKVSHELRSPLSTIHDQIALALRHIAGEEYASDQHLLSRAREKTRGLISLIGDLLDVSRIETGMTYQEPKAIRLEELLQSIVDFLGTSAAKRAQSLKLELPSAPLPSLTADPLALESIFGNLITNAIHYTPEGGRIQVGVDRQDDKVRVRVKDSGFGIEARHLEKIFEKFYRVKDDLTRNVTGTGLGLSIVQGLLNSIGGTIQVESTPGMGSTFTVLLPVGKT